MAAGESFVTAGLQACVERLGGGGGLDHLLLELGVDHVEPFRVFWKLLADVLGGYEDSLERAPRALDLRDGGRTYERE